MIVRIDSTAAANHGCRATAAAKSNGELEVLNGEQAATFQNKSKLLSRSDLDRRRIEHKAAADVADHNGRGHQHHGGGNAAEDESEKS